MAEVAADIGGALLGAAAGFLVGGVVGAAIGGSAGWNLADAAYKTTHPPPAPGEPATPTTTVKPTVGGTPTTDPTSALPTAGTTGTAVVTPNADALAVARAQMEEAQTLQFQESSGMQIFGQKVQEQSAESSFRAGVATRGLKFEGSPLAALAGRKQAAESQIALEERQRTATAAGLRTQSNIEYGTYLLNKNLDVYNYQQGQANLWINAFTNTLNFGTSLMGKLWNPAETGAGGTPAFYGPGYSGGWNG